MLRCVFEQFNTIINIMFLLSIRPCNLLRVINIELIFEVLVMADMEEIVAPAIECGFCLRQGVALPNPRQLTCNHVHCLECLTGFYDENNILICPWEDCRYVAIAIKI